MQISPYDVTLRHDKGRFTLRVWAADAETAKRIACNVECAPERSVIRVKQITPKKA